MADQGLWAVCGQAAGVIDMETAKKQTLLVEVMPLTGGHLALPKVRLSKYIPPAGNQKVEIPNDASKGKLKIVGCLDFCTLFQKRRYSFLSYCADTTKTCFCSNQISKHWCD